MFILSRLTQPDEIFVPKYQTMQDILAKHERGHWLADEADMSLDIQQWRDGTIESDEKEYIKMILRLFTQADHNVCGGYVEKLIPSFKQADARMILLSFAAREIIHVLGYKRLNDTLGYDSEEFMSEFLQYEAMAEKHSFMAGKAELSTPQGLAEYVAKQVLIEGVNLFASFAMLLNFGRRGKLPGMVSVNNWSILDEHTHCEGLAFLFKTYCEESNINKEQIKEAVYKTAEYVVKLENSFIDLCFDIYTPDNLDRNDLKEYILYITDFRLQQLGFPPLFKQGQHKLNWIDAAVGEQLTNFFERTVTSYSKNNMTGSWNESY